MAGETEKLRPVNSIFIPMLLSFTPGREATGAVACQMALFVSTAFRRKVFGTKPFRLKAVLQTQFGLWLVELIDYQTAGLTRRSAPKRLLAAVRAIPEFSSGRGTWR